MTMKTYSDTRPGVAAEHTIALKVSNHTRERNIRILYISLVGGIAIVVASIIFLLMQ